VGWIAFLAGGFVLVGVAVAVVFVLAMRQDRRVKESLADLAGAQGFQYLSEPQQEAQALLDYVKAARFFTTSQVHRNDRNLFSDLLQGTYADRPFRFFRHTHKHAELRTRTRYHSSSTACGGGQMEMRSVTSFVLVMPFGRPLRLQPVWFKRASMLDAVFTLAGLSRARAGAPEIDRRFHFFCADPSFVPQFLAPEVEELGDSLLKGEMVYVDPGFALLASPGYRGPEWLLGKLDAHRRLCGYLESRY